VGNTSGVNGTGPGDAATGSGSTLNRGTTANAPNAPANLPQNGVRGATGITGGQVAPPGTEASTGAAANAGRGAGAPITGAGGAAGGPSGANPQAQDRLNELQRRSAEAGRKAARSICVGC
jgi:hypothetical protein